MSAYRNIPLPVSVVFILGSQRSGTTLLEKMLSSHSSIKGGPEPHLLTPLAYTGFWGQVQKAPYDHIIASLGQQAFVNCLPNREADYYAACRSYCDALYGAYMAESPGMICLDKTPEYTTVWPFLTRVYPDAKYIVLTRHPGAIYDSFARSFFDGDYQTAHAHEPILERYIPALAGFLRQSICPFIHLKYEDLVARPKETLTTVCEFLELPYEPRMVEYGAAGHKAPLPGLGDATGLVKHSRPTDAYTDTWVESMASHPAALAQLRTVVDKLDPADLAAIGFPLDSFWSPLERATDIKAKKKRGQLTSYRIKRKLIIAGRRVAQNSTIVRTVLTKFRLACDVLLREY